MLDFTGVVIKVLVLTRSCCSKARMALAEAIILKAHRRSILGDLCTSLSKMPEFKACRAEDVEAGFSALSQQLAAFHQTLLQLGDGCGCTPK